MLVRTSFSKLIAAALAIAAAGSAAAQGLNQNFNSVTGVGGGTFFSGAGFGETFDWDTGLTAENAFAGTVSNARIGAAAARGSVNAGVGGSGAGVIDVAGVHFDIFEESFSAVTGVGAAVFMTGNGQPDTFGFTGGWDTGISGEAAFAGTFGGATLVGTVTAQGITSGGVGNSGAGRLDVDNVTLGAGNWYGGLQWSVGAFPGASPLLNSNFDDAGGSLNDWVEYSAGFNVLADTITPLSGTHVCKMFGRFSGGPNTSGVYQSLPAQAGQTWAIDVFSRHNTGDSLVGTSNTVLQKIEFWDAGNTLLLQQSAIILSSGSPVDTWIDNTPLQLTAPAGTTSVRAVYEFSQPGVQGGAGLLDNATMRLVSGPSPVNLANFTLQAAVRGTANAAGEVLGDVQLRIEDANGNRRLFRTRATSAYQTLGGPLSTAIEADTNGNPATGVFDVNSAHYTIVVAFDNAATPWGTGGTVDVDDLRLSNSNPAGSNWYAGLYFNGLTLPSTNLSQLALTADVKGNLVGGAYELRLEAQTTLNAGLNQNFNGVTGTGGGLFLDDAAIIGGTTFNYTTNWDDGITGEAAFGGVFGSIDVLPGGGFSARGLVGGGQTGGGGEIRVEDMIIGPGGGWYAGLDWGGQGLASQDLSQVVLSASVRATSASGGPLGQYELRIEDAQGDRMYFPMTANGNWQAVGGPLSTATQGPRLGGGGDGVFNLDSPSYHVVLSFVNPETTWIFGGALAIDNLFLTPVTTHTEIGRVAFRGTANGAFQHVGGPLSSGTTNLGNFQESFSSATGTGGGPYGPAGSTNWDNGLSNENAFFGTFGNAVVGGGASAQACLNCGNPGAAGQVQVTNVQPNTGGWYAGLFWPNVRANLSGNLANVILSADVRGTANTGLGETLGTYSIRVEDSDLTSLQFTVTANGNWQHVGGPLSTAPVVQVGSGDGVFNYNQGTYTVTLAVLGQTGDWGPGATLAIDNLFLTGTSLADADTFTVALSFEDAVTTWGTAGQLTLDNLFLGVACPGDLNGNNVVDEQDLGTLLAAWQSGPGGDLDGDGDTDEADLGILLANWQRTCP
ncbi:MAG: hypothetical protein U1D55_06320 [Phycisphaerae bacterium]